MNFENNIEKEIKAIFDKHPLVIDGSIELSLSGEFRKDFTTDTILIVVNPRNNINRWLWDCDLSLFAISANAKESSNVLLQQMYGIISDFMRDLKADPQQINATLGTLLTNCTSGATITEVAIYATTEDDVLDNISTTGFLTLINSDGDQENITYTDYDATTAIFTVNHLLTHSYNIGDRVRDTDIYYVDGVVNRKESSPLSLDDKRAMRSRTAGLKISHDDTASSG